MTIGADSLLTRYGTRIKVAIALLDGKIDSYDERFVDELVSSVILQAAAIIREEHQDAPKKSKS